MCPACVASAILMASGLMTTGGLAALLINISRSKQSERTTSPIDPTKKEK
jgi:hypothetical protein